MEKSPFLKTEEILELRSEQHKELGMPGYDGPNE
jgi:hypothetical protein